MKKLAIETLSLFVDNVKSYQFDFTIQAGLSGTTVSSVDWTIERGSSVTLGTPTLSANIAQIPITSGSTSGCSLVQCKATLADGQVISKYLSVSVIDPTC